MVRSNFKVKLSVCLIFSVLCVYILGAFVGALLESIDAQLTSYIPAPPEWRGHLVVFVLAFASAWTEFYAKFAAWLDDLIGPQRTRRMGLTASGMTGEQAFAYAQANPGRDLFYRSRMDRMIPYDAGTRVAKKRIDTPFSIRRNFAAMTPQEKAAYMVMEVLQAEAMLPANRADWLTFGLVWGDGRGRGGANHLKIPLRLAASAGLRNTTDLIRYEAAQRGVTSDNAVSELFGRLHTAAAHDNAPDVIKQLASRILPAIR